MPEHLRSLVVILLLAATVYAFAKRPACAHAMSVGDFTRRRNLWFAITLIAFLAHNFWIYILAAGTLLLFAGGRETNKLALFFFLLFAVPSFHAEITGLGIIRHFFVINYLRLLALAILLPAWLKLRSQPDAVPMGRLRTDKFLLGYLGLIFLLQLSIDTFTNTLRHAFYAFTDVFLPYYIASRSLKDLRAFREVCMAFVVAAMVMVPVAAFEFGKHWLLYGALDEALGISWDMGSYLARGESLRASASTGHSIALGYVMAVAIGFYLYIGRMEPDKPIKLPGLAILMLGLAVPLARGPWVGTLVLILLFAATGPKPVLRLVQLGLLGVVAGGMLLASPLGDKIIDHLPFIGTVDAENVVYRERLIEISISVIAHDPLFGAADYIYSPAMQELKQGQGIVDIVNSYLGVMLGTGLVGLSLYVGFFATVLIGIYRSLRSIKDSGSEAYRLGQSLLAAMTGILIIIFTTSSITVIPVIYWSLAGMGVAYARMMGAARVAAEASPRAGDIPAPGLRRTGRIGNTG